MKRTNQNAGFSLIELLVVIAIMAVLAGVGVAGYSIYTEEANKSADRHLVSEIEHALNIAAQAGTFNEGEGGYVLLSTETPFTSTEAGVGTPLDKALEAAFGVGYSLKLSYDGWGSNGLFDNLTPETAFAVKNSSYLTGLRSDDLLKDVETMTNMAQNLVTVLGEGTGITAGMTLSQMFTKDDVCVIDTTAAKYGITKPAGMSWEDWADLNDDNKTAYSNLLVLTAADESEQYMGGVLGTGTPYEMSGASNMILEFSSFYAYAAINDEFSAKLDKYMAHLNGTELIPGLAEVTDASTGAAWYNSLTAAAGPGYAEYAATGVDGQAFVDKVGFLSIMGGIGNPSDEQANQVASDLSNTNLFTNGVVNDMYNDYLDGVDAMSGMYIDGESYGDWNLGLDSGNIVVLVSYNDGVVSVTNSLPNA